MNNNSLFLDIFQLMVQWSSQEIPVYPYYEVDNILEGTGGRSGWNLGNFNIFANFVPPAVTCKRRFLDFELTFKPLLTNRKVRETQTSKRRDSK